jgi:hypothetical protein
MEFGSVEMPVPVGVLEMAARMAVPAGRDEE